MAPPLVFVFSAALLALTHGAWAHSDSGIWDYKDLGSWGGVCSRGIVQSPIDVETDEAETVFAEPLMLINYDRAEPATFKSGPKHIDVRIKGNCMMGMTGGALRRLYILDHIHFHINSEHTINDKRYPMEAHFVHFDSEYMNLTTAAKHPKGLAVLSVLFHKDSEEASNIYFLLNGLQQQRTETPIMAPSRLIPKDRVMFYRYEGSLTTPPCSEVVLWTILKSTLPISQRQIQELKGFLAPGTLNYRPVQKLNGRAVNLVSTIASSHRISPSFMLFFISFIFSLKIAS